METEPTKNALTIPTAIVLAGVLIAGAVFLQNGERVKNVPVRTPEPQTAVQDARGLEKMRPISSSDHILGNPNAPVKIVEYSDTECPFCKRFHPTMQQVMKEYGKQGTVAWVYRHFPLDAIHPKTRKESEATECANELGGNAKFWTYVDRLFAVTPSNNNLDPAELPKIAEYVGLDVSTFTACLSSDKYAQHIQDDLDNAILTGGDGTPWSIVVTEGGKKYSLSGAQPYAAVKQLIELALQDR